MSSAYSSKPVLGCSVSASFSLLSVALRTRARAFDRPGAGWGSLGWTSYSVLLEAGAARLLWTYRRRGKHKTTYKLYKSGSTVSDRNEINITEYHL